MMEPERTIADVPSDETLSQAELAEKLENPGKELSESLVIPGDDTPTKAEKELAKKEARERRTKARAARDANPAGNKTIKFKGRYANKPCPCGSGYKVKRCCGIRTYGVS